LDRFSLLVASDLAEGCKSWHPLRCGDGDSSLRSESQGYFLGKAIGTTEVVPFPTIVLRGALAALRRTTVGGEGTGDEQQIPRFAGNDKV
jgi:hypothetical protein